MLTLLWVSDGLVRIQRCVFCSIVLTYAEYAAAFFLLAGNVQDAVNICANQMQDIQLAIAVARVYDGDEGTVLHDLLEEKVLPLAAFEGNRWMASWAFWMLGRRDMAVRSLIVCHLGLCIMATTPNVNLFLDSGVYSSRQPRYS